MKKRSEVKAEGWSNATLLPQLFEGGVFDDGFVEAHGGDWFTRRRGDAEVGRRGGGETRRWGDVGGGSGNAELSLGVFLQRAKLGLGVPRGAAGLMI